MRAGVAWCTALLVSGCASVGFWLVPDHSGPPAASAPANSARQTREGVAVTVWSGKSAPGGEPAETVFGLRVENAGPAPVRLEEPFAWLSDAEDRDARPMTLSTSSAAVVEAGRTWDGHARFPVLTGKEDAVVLTVAAGRDHGPVRYFFRYRVIHRAPEPRNPIAEEL